MERRSQRVSSLWVNSTAAGIPARVGEELLGCDQQDTGSLQTHCDMNQPLWWEQREGLGEWD